MTAVRLIITIPAIPGGGIALAQAFQERCIDVRKEPGCEQYQVFHSADNADTLVLLELWRDQAALDDHTRLMGTLPPLRPDLRLGNTAREDYEYNRTR